MTDTHQLEMIVLGSGSAGNAIVIRDESTAVLIDCGFSAREISRRLDAVGIAPEQLSALLVTHEHGDHVRGVRGFARRYAPHAVVYATERTATATACAFGREVPRFEPVRAGRSIRIGTLSVSPFALSHDAVDPVGYRIESTAGAACIATDTGVLTSGAKEACDGCAIVGLECNHDLAMLERGPYPAALKRRILSTSGHLSNADASEEIARFAREGLKHLVALHRSETNNTRELAHAALIAGIERAGFEVAVQVARQNAPVRVLIGR